jgi:hypothetical protein
VLQKANLAHVLAKTFTVEDVYSPGELMNRGEKREDHR